MAVMQLTISGSLGVMLEGWWSLWTHRSQGCKNLFFYLQKEPLNGICTNDGATEYSITMLAPSVREFLRIVLPEESELALCECGGTSTSYSHLPWRMLMGVKKRRRFIELFVSIFQWLAPEIPEILVRRFLAEQVIGLFCFATCVLSAIVMGLLTKCVNDFFSVCILRFAAGFLTVLGTILFLYFLTSSGIGFIRNVRKHYKNSDVNK